MKHQIPKVVFDTKPNLSKFETVLVAFTYIRIFDITTPVSDYLHTPGLDVFQAWRMMTVATDKPSKITVEISLLSTSMRQHLSMELRINYPNKAFV
jgi:hypothetical protein